MLYDTSTDVSSSRRHRTAELMRRAAGCVLISCAVLAGCGSPTPDSESELGSSSADTAAGTEPVIDALDAPIPVDALPYDDAVGDNNTTTQSFALQDRSPSDAIDAYQILAEASGWEAETGPSADGLTDYTLTMTKDDRSLLVTTAPAGTDGDTELSLEITTP